MTRLAVVALLAFAWAGVSHAAQQALSADGTVHTTDSWAYSLCGKHFLADDLGQVPDS
jgi:hypothetical protein